MKTTGWLVLALLTLVAAPSWSVAETRKIRVRTLGETETVDWHRAWSIIDGDLIRNIMEGLVGLDSQMKIAPALASSWTISEDGRTYTFKLKPGVKWTDGVPLKAQDFVNGWRRLLSPMMGAQYADLLMDVEGAEFYRKAQLQDFTAVGIKALDDQTFEVKLKARNEVWLWNLAFWPTYPIRQDLVDRHGSAWIKPGNLVTLGAYALTSQDEGRNFVLTRNPSYHGQTGNIEQVTVSFIPSDEAAIAQYQAGQLDLLPRLSSSSLEKLRGRKDLQDYPGYRILKLAINSQRFPGSNVLFRKAIAQAINRSAFTPFMRDRYPLATSIVPPGFTGWSKDMSLPFDLAAAKKSMVATGLDPARIPPIELVTSRFDYLVALAEFVAGELKKNLGLRTSINVIEVKNYSSTILNGQGVPMAIFDSTAKNPDSDHLYSRLLAASAPNESFWSNPKYDEWILSARLQASPAERAKQYQNAERILADDAVLIPLYYGQNWALIRAGLKGPQPNPIRGILYRELSM